MAETDTLRLFHHIRVIHGGTGRPFDRVTARLLDPVWPHWLLRRRGADITLAASDAFAAERPQTTEVLVAVDAPELLERFGNQGVVQVSLQRGADEEVEVELAAAPTQLEVSLIKSDGTPSPGRTVIARGNGHDVDLQEVAAGSHVYRSAPTIWDRSKQPYKVMVNGNKRAQAAPDFTRAVTRLRVVDG